MNTSGLAPTPICSILPNPPHVNPTPPTTTQTATAYEMYKLLGKLTFIWTNTALGNVWIFITGVDALRVHGCVWLRNTGKWEQAYIDLDRITNWIDVAPFSSQCTNVIAECPNGDSIQVLCNLNGRIEKGCRNGRPYIDCFRC